MEEGKNSNGEIEEASIAPEAKKKGAFGTHLGSILLLLAIFLLSLITFSAVYMMNAWNEMSLPMLITQLKTLKGTASSAIFAWFTSAGVPSLVFTAAIGIAALFAKGPKAKKKFLTIALLASLPLNVIAMGRTTAYVDLFHSLVVASQESTFVDENYVEPSEFQIRDEGAYSKGGKEIVFPAKKRNLVTVFMESMEDGYASSEDYEEGKLSSSAIPELIDLEKRENAYSFSGTGKGEDFQIHGPSVMPYTTWTMAALFSYTSGLPFKIPLATNDMDTQDAFFPQATTLGDVLSQEGYEQMFMCGSDAVFGGRELYFKSHGNYEIRDLSYYLAHYKSPDGGHGSDSSEKRENEAEGYAQSQVGKRNDWWGFQDKEMFGYSYDKEDSSSGKSVHHEAKGFAKEELIRMGAQYDEEGKPFHFSCLTVDTHFGNPDGDLCDLCPSEEEAPGISDYQRVILCSSRQVSNFVKWFYGEDGNTDLSPEVRENTAFLLAGDHPTMSRHTLNGIHTEDRHPFFAILNPAESALTDYDAAAPRDFTHFDAFPTLLSALGAKITGERLCLGTNLFANPSSYPTRSESYGAAKERTALENKTPLLDKLLSVDVLAMGYLSRHGMLPSGAVSISPLDESGEFFQVSLSGVSNLPEEMEKAVAEVRYEGEPAQTVSYPMEKNGDGYRIAIPLSDFSGHQGTYTASVSLYGATYGQKNAPHTKQNVYSMGAVSAQISRGQ